MSDTNNITPTSTTTPTSTSSAQNDGIMHKLEEGFHTMKDKVSTGWTSSVQPHLDAGWEKTKEVGGKAGEKLKEGYQATKDKATELMHKNKTPEGESGFDKMHEQPTLSNPTNSNPYSTPAEEPKP